jgi:hypothetical protein
MHPRSRLALLIWFVLLLGLVAPASAGWLQYGSDLEVWLPSVRRIEPREDGIRIVLGPKWWKGNWAQDPDRSTAPVLSVGKDGRWRMEQPTTVPQQGAPPECAAKLPPISLAVEEAIALRPHIAGQDREYLALEQNVEACQQVGDVIWFGISYYDGEGSEGVGGVGRYDLATKKLEVRRPAELREASVSHLVHDGNALWLATYASFESGDTPASGLVRYDWEKDIATPQSLCGFFFHDMVLIRGDLWVASEMGLARGRLGENGLRQWENFIPVLDQPSLVQPVWCEDLYAKLLETVPRPEGDVDSDDLWNLLVTPMAKHRPEVVGRILREQLGGKRVNTGLPPKAKYRPFLTPYPQIIQWTDYPTIVAIEEFVREVQSRGDGRVSCGDARAIMLAREHTDVFTKALFSTVVRLLSDLSESHRCGGARVAQFAVPAYKKRSVAEFDFGPVAVTVDAMSNGPDSGERLYTLDRVDWENSFFQVSDADRAAAAAADLTGAAPKPTDD